MPFQLTSATDKRALMDALYAFATANGWTGVYNNATTTGQIALSNGNCEVAIGEITGEDLGNAPLGVPFSTLVDRLYFSLSTGLNVATPDVFSHVGTPSRTASRCFCDDLIGPMNTVYFFTDSDTSPRYIHCQIQANDGFRWTGFSFGLLDKNDLTHPDVAFLVTDRFAFWQTSAINNSNENMNRMEFTNVNVHNYRSNFTRYQMRLVPGVLNSTLGFTDDDRIISHDTVADTSGGTNGGQFIRPPIQSIRDNRERSNSSSLGGPNQNYINTANQNTTGGAPLWAIPVFIQNSGALISYVGEIPDMRMVDARSFGPGSTFQQGADTWQSFPFCRAGDDINTGTGSNPIQLPNSAFYGQAIKVIS